jgi:hypothetical protein
VTTQTAALIELATWHKVAAWIDYVAMEWVADNTTRGYLFHVAQCVREEGERILAARVEVE